MKAVVCTVSRGEVSVGFADILPLVAGWIHDLHVGGEVSVAPELAELVEILVGHGRDIELMVS